MQGLGSEHFTDYPEAIQELREKGLEEVENLLPKHLKTPYNFADFLQKYILIEFLLIGLRNDANGNLTFQSVDFLL